MMGGEEKKKRGRGREVCKIGKKKRGEGEKKMEERGGGGVVTAQHYAGSNVNLVTCTCHHSKTKKKIKKFYNFSNVSPI
jgi:hypothetical protein